MRRVSLALLIALALSTFPAATARADIYQWAWVNPSDQTQGKYQSTTLCPGGKGVNAVPSANLNSCDLTQAYLIGGDLTAATLQAANLTNADLSAVNCTNASFEYADYHSGYNIPATLTNANLSGANLTSANFGSASLSNANLSGANLTSAIFCNEWSGGANLTNANLNGANLTNASFFDAAWGGANLTNANLTNAIVQGASLGGVSGITAAQLYSTASYAAGDLAGISLSWRNLTSWSFAGQNLANANFFGVTLSNADLTNANVRNVDFTEASGLTAAQLYSTASYKAKDLTGIVFGKWSGSALPGLNFTSWNFAGQNLTKVSFYNATLTGADLTGANVTGADFAHTTAKGFTAAQLYSTASYKAKDLTTVAIRVGLIGEERASRLIHDKIGDNLVKK